MFGKGGKQLISIYNKLWASWERQLERDGGVRRDEGL